MLGIVGIALPHPKRTLKKSTINSEEFEASLSENIIL